MLLNPCPQQVYLSVGYQARPHGLKIVNMPGLGKITDDAAVQIIQTILDRGGSPGQIVSALGLTKAGDDAVLRAVREAVAEGVAAVEDFRAGNERALNFIVCQVMKKTKGRADPAEVHRQVMEEVKGGRIFFRDSHVAHLVARNCQHIPFPP